MADEPVKTDVNQSIPLASENTSQNEVSADNKKVDDSELDSKTVQVKIYSPFKTYFSGPATSVSAENDSGPFDVLPKHHRFITILNPGDIIVRTEEGEHKYRIARGVMHVKNNAIVIFLDV